MSRGRWTRRCRIRPCNTPEDRPFVVSANRIRDATMRAVPVDPLFQPLLDMPAMQLAPPPPETTPAMLRAALRALPMPVVTSTPIHATRNITILGPAGPLSVRLYYPSAPAGQPL